MDQDILEFVIGIGIIALLIFVMIFVLATVTHGVYDFFWAPEKCYEVTYTDQKGEPVTIITGEDKKTDMRTGIYHHYGDYYTAREIKKGD